MKINTCIGYCFACCKKYRHTITQKNHVACTALMCNKCKQLTVDGVIMIQVLDGYTDKAWADPSIRTGVSCTLTVEMASRICNEKDFSSTRILMVEQSQWSVLGLPDKDFEALHEDSI